jgi:hypothetical protein
MKGKRSPGISLFDKLLIPRIQNYGSNNDITDTDSVIEYLRRNYKEYTRHKLPVFRQQVERAVEAIARRGGVSKAELRLQVGSRPRRGADLRWCLLPLTSAAVCGCMVLLLRRLLLTTAWKGGRVQALDRQHQPSKQEANSSGGGSKVDGSSSGDGGSSSSKGADGSDLEPHSGAPCIQADSAATPGSGMNRSMMSLYGSGQRADAAPAGDAAAQEAAAHDEVPAFAPPNVIAAAAARAVRDAAQQKAAGGGPQATAAASASMELGSAAQVEEHANATSRKQQQQQQQQQEQQQQQQQQQQADDAAPSTSGRTAPGTAARTKRGGATPADRCLPALSVAVRALPVFWTC